MTTSTQTSQNLLVTAVLLIITATILSTTSAYSISDKRQDNLPSSTKPPYLFNSRETHWGSSEEYAWYYSDDDYSEEEACPSDRFWHIRGKRCVPFTCPRANWLRDWKTGECLHDEEPAKGSEASGSELKTFGGGRPAFKTVLRLRPAGRHIMTRARGGTGSKWLGTVQKKKVYLDDSQANPTKTLGLIGKVQPPTSASISSCSKTCIEAKWMKRHTCLQFQLANCFTQYQNPVQHYSEKQSYYQVANPHQFSLVDRKLITL